MGKYLVLRDNNEHDGHGWLFEKSDTCAGTVEKNLFTGDYSLDGYYDNKLFVIERKGSVSEFVKNISTKEGWDDFKDELQRLEEFRYPFIILEFPLSLLFSYPVGSGIPKQRWDQIRVTPQFLMKRFLEIELHFKTKIIPAEDKDHKLASSLFKRIIELYPSV